MEWILENKELVILLLVGFARVIVNAVPVLEEGHWAIPYIKFIGKFIALSEKMIDNRPKSK